MIAHYDATEQVANKLQANPETGFKDDKAQELLRQYGENRLREKKKKTNWQRFLEQFKDVMILILIAAAIISFAVAVYEGHGFFEPALILLIVVLNAVMGVMQESKAEKALEALKSLFAPHARVLRNGNHNLNYAAAISTALVALVVFIPPIATIFGLTQLSAGMYVGALLLAFVPVSVLEMSKRFGLIKHHH